MKVLMKVLKVIVNTVINILYVCVLAIFAVYGWCHFTDKEIRVVMSGSMEPAIGTGSLCLIDKAYPYEDIVINDIIAFRAGNAYVTHRVVSITDEGMETKGDANTYSDGISTTEDNYYGKTIGAYAKLGYLYTFSKSKRGLIIWLTVIAVLFLSKIFLDEWEKEHADRKNSDQDAVCEVQNKSEKELKGLLEEKQVAEPENTVAEDTETILDSKVGKKCQQET